jgi:hypothetical protein
MACLNESLQKLSKRGKEKCNEIRKGGTKSEEHFLRCFMFNYASIKATEVFPN